MATSVGLATSVRVVCVWRGWGVRTALGSAAAQSGTRGRGWERRRNGRDRARGRFGRLDEERGWMSHEISDWTDFVAEVRRATMTMGSRYMRKQLQPITANGSAIRRQLLVGDVAG